MRASGVRGLLIYCSDYHCSHWTAIDGPMMPGCRIWSRDLLAKLAAGAVRRSGPIGNRLKRMPNKGWPLARLPFRFEISGPYGTG